MEFSTTAVTYIQLKDFSDLPSLTVAVLATPYLGQTTSFANALNMLNSQSFLPSNGGRPPPVRRVAILITDGAGDDLNPAATLAAAQACRNSSIYIVGVGVAKELSVAVLTAQMAPLVSNPNEIVTVNDFSALPTQSNILIANACNGSIQQPTTTTPMPPPGNIIMLSSDLSTQWHYYN